VLSAALSNLPEDKDALKAMVAALLHERDAEKRRANDLHIENLRLQVELDRYKKQYYGPRADRLKSWIANRLTRRMCRHNRNPKKKCGG